MLLCQSIDVLSRFILQLYDRLWSEKKIKISPIGLRFDLQEQKERKKIQKFETQKINFWQKKILVFGKTICKNFFFVFLEMKMISKWQFSSYYGKRTRRVFTKLLTNVLRWSFGMVVLYQIDQGPYSQNFTFFITY